MKTPIREVWFFEIVDGKAHLGCIVDVFDDTTEKDLADAIELQQFLGRDYYEYHWPKEVGR